MKNLKSLAIIILMITTMIILSTKVEATTGTINSETVRVYNNGDNATLSHLLEFGHRTKLGMTYKQRKPAKTKRKRDVSGHRKPGKKSTVAPQEHIRPAYNKIAKEYEEDMKRIKLKVTIKH